MHIRWSRYCQVENTVWKRETGLFATLCRPPAPRHLKGPRISPFLQGPKLKLGLSRDRWGILQQPAAISRLICLMHAGVRAASRLFRKTLPASSLVVGQLLGYFYTSKCCKSISCISLRLQKKKKSSPVTRLYL